MFPFLESKQATNGKEANQTDSEDGPSKKSIEELMNVILVNEGDYVFILSLSGKIIKATSSKPDLRKAYLLLSAKVFTATAQLIVALNQRPLLNRGRSNWL